MKKRSDIAIVETLFHLAHHDFKEWAQCKRHVNVTETKYPEFKSVQDGSKAANIPSNLFSGK